MTSLSTPRASRPASPDRDADGPEPSQEIMTPGRRVKALLAAFDDSGSSESENERPRASSLLKTTKTAWPWEKKLEENNNDDKEEDEEEDDAVIVPRGRLAARMQAEDNASEETNLNRQNVTPRAEGGSSFDEQGPITKLKRRFLSRGTKVTRADTVSAPRSPRRDRSESPLFVQSDEETELRQNNDDDAGDEQELPAIPAGKKERLMALIEAKRKEREERERLEAEKNAARMERMQQFSSDVLSDEEESEEGDTTKISRKMTQEKARKPRKASKKALEEMARETQRMSRNMQLAYQEITKKKITKESFLARFNFGLPKESSSKEPGAANSSSVASSPPSSSAGEEKKDVTPPTSPDLSFSEQRDKSPKLDLEDANEVANPEPTPSAVGKGKSRMTQIPVANVRVRVSREEVARHQKEAPDDELEIITSPAKCRRIAAFENLPSRHAQEPEPILKLKHLAHLTSPSRRSKSVTPAELSAALRAQAREQAAKERQEKIEELRARGVVIETAEERAAMEDEVEDILEKARREAAELSRRERAEQEAGAGADDDEDDADYELSGSEEEEEAGLGDEDEDVDEEELEDEEDGEEEDQVMVEEDDNENENDDKAIDEEASEGEPSEDENSEAMTTNNNADAITTAGPRRRPLRVVSDDEDEEPKSPQVLQTPARSITTLLDSAKRPQFPDMPGSKTATMSLSQAFAGTLGDNPPEVGDDALDDLEEPPDPAPSIPDLRRAESEILVKDSQEDRRGSIDFGNYTQSISRVSESPMTRGWSQASQIPEPTQDAGFVLSQFDQSKRFVGSQASTVDTVLLSQHGSPLTKKKGRLLRRGRRAESNDSEDESSGFEVKASAFDVMRKSLKKAAIPFDKNKSLAKEHVEEAAEESDDEYAGLGGASDDSSGEEDEEDRAMINDDNNEEVDEKELAALNAYVHDSNSTEREV